MSSSCPRCAAEIPERSLFCPRCGSRVGAPGGAEPEFRAWRIRVCKRLIVFCAAACVIGLFFLRANPATTLIVSGLGVFGLVVGLIRLSRLRRLE